jgi:hypothetical protein
MKTPLGPKPNLGDVIYIRSSMSFSHPWDDMVGGKATIIAIEESVSAGEPTWFVSVRGKDGHIFGSYNYPMLLEQQDKLKAQYGDSEAYLDPDDNYYGDDDWV